MQYGSLDISQYLKSENIAIYPVDDDHLLISIPSGTASGTDTYTVTINGIDEYAEGQLFSIVFTNGNTGSATLNVNGFGALTLKKSVSTNLSASDISAGQALILRHDGTNLQVIGLGGSGSGGHTLQNNGTSFTARTNLNAVGSIVLEDDSSNNATKLSSPGADIFLYLNFD